MTWALPSFISFNRKFYEVMRNHHIPNMVEYRYIKFFVSNSWFQVFSYLELFINCNLNFYQFSTQQFQKVRNRKIILKNVETDCFLLCDGKKFNF